MKQTRQERPAGEIPLMHLRTRLNWNPGLTEIQLSAPQTAHKALKENRMKHYNVMPNRTTRRILPSACAAALAVAFTVSLSQPAFAGQVTRPSVPANIEVPAGNEAFLVGHALGTQNYVCRPSAASPSGVAYALFTPEATLFNGGGVQLITHFFSPNPNPLDPNTSPAVVADGAIRATWQHRDTSTVWAKVHQFPDNSIGSSTDPHFVEQGAIAWLLLKVVGAVDGPTGGDTLTKTTFIQRVKTSGGLAPSTGCASPTDLGNQAFVDYRADYFFYFDPKADR